MKENYLAKWLNNELSEAELEAFRKSEAFSTYERIAKASAGLQAPEFDSEKALNELREKRTSRTSKVIRMRTPGYWLKIAAAVIVLIAVPYFYINSLSEKIQTDYAQRTEVQLPDASEVILNAGSSLSFSEKKWDENRNVRLEGEAYFKVAKGKKFTVQTKKGDVTVLGTQFNVVQRGDIFIVRCYEGLVRVDHLDKKIELPAGHSYRFVNGQAVQSDQLAATAPSWIGDESSFQSMPLSYVLSELERQYNIKVITKNVDLQEVFTGTFSNTNMNLALQSISAPLQLKFSINGNKVLLYAENTP
ncbi:FecR family protein [Robiginitalea sp. IMCC43444]|uniref:FecR family protein n=1 Tax=Robiginitalea sp. IMCC43444 TaxID=3459121 RepID=UPI004042123C